MKNKLLVSMLFVIVMISLVSAVPPFESSTASGGLEFAPSTSDYIKADTDFTIHIHVKNGTAIQTNATTSCLVHLYNSVGDHIYENWIGYDSNGLEFEQLITAGNQTEGDHSYIGYCNNTNSETHLVKGYYKVTYNGKAPTEQNIIIFFSLLIIAIVVLLLTSLLAIIYNLINWSLDGKDMTIAVSIYFGLFMTYILAVEYLGNQLIEELLLLFIEVGALTHVIIPLVGFFMYFFRSNLDRHRSNPND